jgi:hypothetical protein
MECPKARFSQLYTCIRADLGFLPNSANQQWVSGPLCYIRDGYLFRQEAQRYRRSEKSVDVVNITQAFASIVRP